MPNKKKKNATSPDDSARGSDVEQSLRALVEILSQRLVVTESKSFTGFNRTFSGEERGLQLEGFIDALSTFKERHSMSDEDARQQFSQLLRDSALSWWMTTGRLCETWTEVVRSLRETFGTVEKDYVLLSEITRLCQRPGQSVSSFVAELLELNTRRRVPIPELLLVEFAYLGVDHRIRDRLRIEQVNSKADFRTLTTGIEADLQHSERVAPRDRKPGQATPADDRRGAIPKRVPQQATGFQDKSERRFRDYASAVCDNCHSQGWWTIPCSRYGPCSKRGLTKDARQVKRKIVPLPVSSRVIKRASASAIRPVCVVTIGDERLPGLFDTGADVCVAGDSVFHLCLSNEIPMKKIASPRMADGKTTTMETYLARLPVTCEGKTEEVDVMVQPNRVGCHFLVGFNFMQQAGVCLQVAEGDWHYADNPNIRHTFASGFYPLRRKVGDSQERADVLTVTILEDTPSGGKTHPPPVLPKVVRPAEPLPTRLVGVVPAADERLPGRSDEGSDSGVANVSTFDSSQRLPLC